MSGTDVGVLGSRGRMGSEVCRAVDTADDMELAASVDAGDSFEALDSVDVAVDFTHPDAVLDNVRWCVGRGIHVVVGTSGFDDRRFEQVRSFLDETPGVGVLVAPNFSLGAVLMMRFAAQAASLFESAEIVELHHRGKADAPSGTARRTASLISEARTGGSVAGVPDSTTSGLDGARGADVDDVRVHSVRLDGLVAHQEVLFGGHSETLTLRHDSMHRSSFMPGVLLGIRHVTGHAGLTVGLDAALGLD